MADDNTSETRAESQEVTADDSTSETKVEPQATNAATGTKRPNDEAASAKAKRFKTTKERREHFVKNNTWNARNQTRKPSEGPKEPRLPKKKAALLLGFNGTGYQGMQLNPSAKTIEGEVFDALCKAGAISKDNSDDPKKVQWMRAARTDKGVHAAGNVLSLKFQIPSDDIVEKINSYLPDQIRVWGYIITNKSFHAKTACDSRIYEYLLPTYAFMPPRPREITDEPKSEDDLKIFSENTTKYIRRSTKEELLAQQNFRISKEDLEQFRQAMSMFVGTHNFHNYTVGRSSKDKSCFRYIININVLDPIIIEGTEWLSVKLHGQSFMLHQIRKMIAMALLAVRSKTPLKIIQESFKDDRINIPKAPALGLLLERPLFDSYNKKTTHKSNQVEREEVNFDKYGDKIEKFKHEWIYGKIFAEERENAIFDVFLSMVDSVTGPDYSYLNPEGVIPKEAIVTTKYNQGDEASNKSNASDGEASSLLISLS